MPALSRAAIGCGARAVSRSFSSFQGDLPGSLPGFFTGLRIAVTVSWLALVVVEQINATSGIGYLMTQARNYGKTDVIVVGLVVYAVFGLASDSLVRLIEGRALSWRRTLAT